MVVMDAALLESVTPDAQKTVVMPVVEHGAMESTKLVFLFHKMRPTISDALQTKNSAIYQCS
jgi:hypothetical protein